MNVHPPLERLLGLVALLFLGGCAQELDMGKAYEAHQPATIIDYQGVAEANRQFPDYGGIRASILADPSASASPATEAAPKSDAKGRKKP